MSAPRTRQRHMCTFTPFVIGGFARIVMGGAPAPPDPAGFVEQAAERGLTYFVTQNAGAGRGVACVDLDGDGDVDVITLGAADGVVGVFENDGGGYFKDRSGACGLPILNSASGVSAADYDADGDLDLYFTCWLAANVLARNDGGLQFKEVGSAAGVADVGDATGMAWGDYDGDGWLDLYVCNIYWPNRLYRNLGDGTFTDTAFDLGVAYLGFSWDAVFFDYDGDGDADLYVSNDKGHGSGGQRHNYLFENTGGQFEDVTGASGTAAYIDSMGITVGDFDHNGFPDLYCTNIQLGNVLFMNNGDKTFTEAGEDAGVLSNAIGWGAAFFDGHNDGELNLFVCNQSARNRLYDVPGAWPCVDLMPPGLEAVDSYVVACADIDHDGDLDLIEQSYLQPIRLYVNQTDGARHWIQFRVADGWPNLDAIGAVVRVRKGASWQMREVMAGGVYKAHSDSTLHFGLDQAEIVEETRASWPRGETRTLTGYGADRAWRLLPAALLGDADFDGDIDRHDWRVLRDCLEALLFEPGCEMFDFGGDADVDLLDLLAMLREAARLPVSPN